MSKPPGNALVVHGKDNSKAEKVDNKPTEKITPPVEIMHIHSALLLAAEASTSETAERPYLSGVFVHRREKMGRVVGANGERGFIGSFYLASPIPSWLKDGVLLSGEGLKKRVQMIMGMQSTPMIKIAHTKGSGFAELSDENGDAQFRVRVLNMPYADYEKAIGPQMFSVMDEDGNVVGREFEPVGLNSRHLKYCGDIAKTLEAAIPKKQRPINGMIVRAYNASATAPMFFSFESWPGAVLFVFPARLASAAIAKETMVLITPAVKLTLAALRAHVTRNLAWAEQTDDPNAKASFEEKAQGFKDRIARIIGQTGMPALANETEKPADQSAAPEPTPEPTPEQEPGQEPEDDATDHEAEQEAEDEEQKPIDEEDRPDPEVKRTPIRVQRSEP